MVVVWIEFVEIYKVVNDWNFEKDFIEFFMKVKEWIFFFVSLNGKREGYEKVRVILYMYIMVVYIFKFFEFYYLVKIFIG